MRQFIIEIFVLLAVFGGAGCASRQPIVEAQTNQNSSSSNTAQTNKSVGVDNSRALKKQRTEKPLFR